MADSLHNALSNFRNTMLTAVACLEFELRDSMKVPQSDMRIDTIMSTLNEVSEAVSNLKPANSFSPESSDILQITPSTNTKNIVVKNTTPALTAAVAAFNPPSMDLEEGSVEEETEVEEDVVELDVEEFEYKGVTYQRDDQNNVYLDGEEIGIWNGKKIIPSV